MIRPFNRRNRGIARLILALLCAATALSAGTFSFSGSLTSDDDQASFYFTLAAAETVTLQTSSFAAGGFDPSLAVFDVNGNLIANNRDGGCANVAPNPSSGLCWDAFLSLNLPAGTYRLVLTQSANVANGPSLANAFAYTGQSTFTRGPESTGTDGFWDATGTQRSAAFSVGLQGVDNAFTPLLVTRQTPPPGKVGVAYSWPIATTGGTQPAVWTIASGTLPPGLALSQTGTLAGTPTTFGTYTVAVQVTDSSTPQMTAMQSFQITVAAADLLITTSSLPIWVTGAPFATTLTAIGGYPPYSWSLAPNAPASGLALSAGGVLSGTPVGTGAFTIPVQTADSQNNITPGQLTWQVNPALQITSAASLPPGITGQLYPAFTFMATGGASPSNAWSISTGTAPPGTSFAPTGILQGSTTAKGTYTFTVQATDNVQPAHQTVTLNVYDPLTITTAALPGGTAGNSFGPVTLTASGGSGTYSWTSANLPPGLTLSTGGQISGVPASGGSFSATLNLRDIPAGQTASVTLNVAIGYQPLLISSSGVLGGVALGSAVSKTFTASGGKPPYNWSATGLPSGLSIDPYNGSLSGTAIPAGNFNFSIQVVDAQQNSSTISGSLSILGFTTTSLPPATTIAAYSQTFAVTGGTPPYIFGSQGVPAGLFLDGSGVLSGIAKTAGTYSLTVQATDAAGISISSVFTLTVSAPTTLTVSGATLAGNMIGVPYSDVLAANGGAPPYTWAVIGGALPDGLTLAPSGTVAGTPTKLGTFTFTVQATDSTGGTASGVTSITISPQPLTIPSMTALPDGIAGSNYFSQILAPSGGLGPYTFSISSGSLPSGLSLSNGQITGTPSGAGTFNFTIAIADSNVPPATTSLSLQALIKPAQVDLLLSSASLSFDLATGASGLPAPASVPVRSSDVQQLLNYSVQLIPAVSWLNVSSGGVTPGSIAVALDPSTASLPSSSTPYQTTMRVNCVSPSPCAGSTQSIAVSLSVDTAPPQLSIANSLLSFGLTAPVAQTSTQSLLLGNPGGGTIGIRSAVAADGWVTISGVPGSIASGQSVAATATVNTTGLTPGFYRSSISITSSAGTASVPVTLLYAQSSSIALNPAGRQFLAQQGGAPGNPAGSFSVAVASGGTVNWTAAVQSGAPWLKLGTPSGTSNSATSGTVIFSIDPAVTSTLTPQAYYGLIRITSKDVFNSPQDFEVVLNIVPATDPAQPDPEPAGLVFLSGASLPPQSVRVFTSSTAPTGFQASVNTTGGAAWLSVTPATGTTSSTGSALTTVTADPTGLAPGVYRGGVSYAFAGAAVRTVNVTLIVPASSATPRLTSHATSCTPATLVPTQAGLVNNFAQPASWPTPLSILLLDDCGTPVTGAQVVATFSNGDPPLPLTLADAPSGLYATTWTPRKASSQVTITARASAPGFSAATALITGQVNPNIAPVLTPGATLHVFDPLVGGALGPGNIVQIYGAYLASGTTVAQSIPLSTDLGGTSVVIGGVQAPIYFASPGQINAQVPFELTSGRKYQILISANGALTTPDTIQLSDASPGIAAFAGGQIIAQHLDGTLVTESAPAKPSEIIVFYLAGLGLTDNPVASGAASPGTVLARPVDIPSLTLNGASVPILFGGLTPGLVGLYQINFQLPNDAPDGDLQLVVSQNGVQSNQTILPVKH